MAKVRSMNDDEGNSVLLLRILYPDDYPDELLKISVEEAPESVEANHIEDLQNVLNEEVG